MISNSECVSFFEPSQLPSGVNPESADTWIFERSGIRERRWVSRKFAGTGKLVDSELDWVIRALPPEVEKQPIHAIISVRSNPSGTIPGISQQLAKHLKLHEVFTLDLQQPSTGLLAALEVAAHLPYQNILIVVPELLSPFLNLNDFGTSMLFGDGVGTLLLSKGAALKDKAIFEIEDTYFYSKPDSSNVLKFQNSEEGFQMKGLELFKKAIPEFKNAAQTLLQRFNLNAEEVEWYLPHQANLRMIQKTAEQLGIPKSKIITNLERVGNTSAASMVVALSDFLKMKKLNSGERVLLNACGAGLSAGSSLWRAL